MELGGNIKICRTGALITLIMGVAAGQSFIAIMMGVDTPLAILKMGASAMMLGLTYSAWALGRAGTGLVAGYLFDQSGGKRGLLLSFGMLGLVAWGYSLLAGPWIMAILRLFQGASAGIYWTSVLAIIGHNVPPAHRVRRLAVFNGAVALGGMAGGMAGGWLVSTEGFAVPFQLGGIVAVGLFAVVALFLPGDRRSQRINLSLPVQLSPKIAAMSILGGLSQVPSFLSNAAAPLELMRFGMGAGIFGIENAALVFGNLLGQGVIFRKPALVFRKSGTLFLYALGICAVLGISYAPSGWILVGMLALLGSLISIYGVLWTAAIQARAATKDTGKVTGALRTTGDTMSAASYPLIGWAEHDPGITGLMLVALLGGTLGYIWRHYAALFDARDRQ